MKTSEYLADLDERQTQFHIIERVDRKNIDKYPVLKELLRMRMAGEKLEPAAAKYLKEMIG
jgi:predicted PP-loop superfamily ATPase